MFIEDAIKALWYAPPGHGKTTLLGTAVNDERVSPMLLLEFEGGTRSIQSKIRKIKLEELEKRSLHSIKSMLFRFESGKTLILFMTSYSRSIIIVL